MEGHQLERGVALLAAIVVVLIFSLLGTLSWNLASQEIQSVGIARDEAMAQQMAEAGVDLVVRWFHDPHSAPPGPERTWFVKRYNQSDASPSFFDPNGISQFTGTRIRPDVEFVASQPDHDRLLNESTEGWIRSLRRLGRILHLKIYGPSRPGLLCTVEVTAKASKVTRTISVQLAASSIPVIRAGIQVAKSSWPSVSGGKVPGWVHWAEMSLGGDTPLGPIDALPEKTGHADITGLSYAEMGTREDRWLDIRVGGEAIFAGTDSSPVALPSNVYAHQEPVPGLGQDRWDYLRLKQEARRYGAYYARGSDGLLYRDGRIEPGRGVTAQEAFDATAAGKEEGLIFVDTLDQQPPREDNLGILSLGVHHLTGYFVLNAHLQLEVVGEGQRVTAFPPLDTVGSHPDRQAVPLRNIHLTGVLLTPGDLTYTGPLRIYGALVVGGRLVASSGASAPLELWYDDDLRRGLAQGVPIVYVAQGTWREVY